jgi:hypothetical protein
MVEIGMKNSAEEKLDRKERASQSIGLKGIWKQAADHRDEAISRNEDTQKGQELEKERAAPPEVQRGRK